jgi:hypothetical protein
LERMAAPFFNISTFNMLSILVLFKIVHVPKFRYSTAVSLYSSTLLNLVPQIGYLRAQKIDLRSQ